MNILLRRLASASSSLHIRRGLSAAASADLKLTDSCVRRLQNVLKNPNEKLRVLVEGGGCSGFQYKFHIENTTKGAESSQDQIIERDGVQVIIDKDSLELLKGSTIDYQEELIRSSFRIVNNPNAEQGCSCGTSFSIK